MKCKAKWNSALNMWLVWCGTCGIQTWEVNEDDKPIPPHDMAIRHARRYHSYIANRML